MDGVNYAKYGTMFDNQLLVIDKTGKTTEPVLTRTVKGVGALPAMLEGIRNDRQEPNESGSIGEPVAAEPDRGEMATGGGATTPNGNGRADVDALGAGQPVGTGATGSAPPGRKPAGVADRPDGGVGTTLGAGIPDQPGGRGGRGSVQPGRSGGTADSGGSGGISAGKPVQRDGGDDAVGNAKGDVKIEVQETLRCAAV